MGFQRRIPSLSRARSQGGFDFTRSMWDLCHDATRRVPDLAHIDMRHVAVGFSQTRSRVLHGLQAKLIPLRFEGGRIRQKRRGRMWTVERLFDQSGREMLYVLSFYLPRFLQQPMHEKLTTIFHELLHISPAFDGDLRRFPGRCYAHSHSQHEFDEVARKLAQTWLARHPSEHLHAFLRDDFDTLQRRHGRVYGLRIQMPRLIPLGNDEGEE